MKRFTKVFLVLVLISAFGYWGYKQLRKSSSLLGKIHINADSVLKIGVHEIKETLVLDVLTSPGYYLDKVRLKDSDKPEKLEPGVDLLPFNLVFFTLPEVENTLFGTFLITDSADFELYVKQELDKEEAKIDEVANSDIRLARVHKSKMALAWNSKKLVVAFSDDLGGKTLQKAFEDILKDDATLQDKDHPLIEAIARNNDHVVYIKGESNVRINFEDEKALVTGDIYTETPQRFQQEISMAELKSTSLLLYLDTNFENPMNKTDVQKVFSELSFFTKNNLNAAEILNRTNGFFSLEIDGNTTQLDTVITYEYDDNFEKVAKYTTRSKKVPRMHLNIGTENESLKAYLISQNAVNANGVFELFPLYRLHVKDGSMHTTFDTYAGRLPTQEKIKNSFFGCYVDFTKLRQDIALPLADKYFENISELQVFASQKEGNRIAIKGQLSAGDSDINILSQFSPQKQQDSVQ